MRTLLIGGTSSLGIALKQVFSKFGETITAGRNNCDIPLNLNDSVENMNIPDGLDMIIHTAASFGGATDTDILDAEKINALGTLKLCQLASRASAKHFIMISSIYSCLDEKSEYYNIYALSKRHAEDLARFYFSSHILPLTILRPSQIYDTQESFRKHQPLFYLMVDKAAKGEDIEIYGSHDPRRNFIHVEDLAEIILKVALGRIEGTYSCLHPIDITFSEIAQAAISAFNSMGTVRFLKDKEDILDNIFEKDDLLYQKIGFYPKISINDGMARIAHYRDAQL